MSQAADTTDWADPFRLETARLSIEPCSAAAARSVQLIVSDPRVAQPYYLGQTSALLPVGALEDWQQSSDGWARHARFNFAVASRSDSQVVGCVQFTTTQLSYFVAPAFWRQGYGREMVLACCQQLPQRLGIHALQAIVVRENMASRRILEHAGFAFSALATQPRSDRRGAVMVLHCRREFAAPAWTGAPTQHHPAAPSST